MAEALEAMGLSEAVVINLQENAQLQTLLAYCDPRRSLEGEEVFLGFWGEVRNALSEIERAFTNTSNTTAFPTIF